MRSSCLGMLMGLLACAACTMPNPRFGASADGNGEGETGSEGENETTEGDSESGGSEEGTTGTTQTTDDGSTTDATTTDATSSTTDGGTCDYGRTEALDIRVSKADPNTPCPGSFQSNFKVKESVANGVTVEPCAADGCSQCDVNGPVLLTLAPLDPEVASSCLWVVTELLVKEEADACHYAGVTVWDELEMTETPIIVGSTADYGTPGAALNPLGAFMPLFKPLGICDCADVVDVQDCCESEPPMAAKLDVNGMGVAPTQSIPIHLGQDQKQFMFHNVQSYRPGTCGAPKQVGWALLR